MEESLSSRLDYLVTRLNINGAPLELFPNGIPDFSSMDVHGALGQGRLSREAYLIGTAVYQSDEAHELQIKLIGRNHIARMFASHNWSDTKAHAWLIQEQLEKGILTPEETPKRRQFYALRFKSMLSELAMDEIKNNDNCLRCAGAGTTPDYRPCARCSGTGKSPFSDQFRAEFVHVQKHAWLKTWRYRYREIFTMYLRWLMEFDEHLMRHCR